MRCRARRAAAPCLAADRAGRGSARRRSPSASPASCSPECGRPARTRRCSAGSPPAAMPICAPSPAPGTTSASGCVARSSSRMCVAITDFLRLTPAEGGWRVVIVDGAEWLNRNAANALLKILEEPPPRVVLLLVCAAPGRLLPTIRSRCRRLRLAGARGRRDGDAARPLPARTADRGAAAARGAGRGIAGTGAGARRGGRAEARRRWRTRCCAACPTTRC